MLQICDTVRIPSRLELFHLFDSINLPADQVANLPMNSENMTQTSKRELYIAKEDKHFLLFRDTVLLY